MGHALENYDRRIWLLAFLLFLLLMLLWPAPLQEALEPLLVRWTVASTIFCLEALGYTVSRDDSFIHILTGGTAMNEMVHIIHVTRVCGGLRLVTALFLVSVFLAMMLRRPWWQNLAVMASSLPIALLCNTIRVTATSLVSTMVKDEGWGWQVFHYGIGYAMVVPGVAAMLAEFWLLGGNIIKKKGGDT